MLNREIKLSCKYRMHIRVYIYVCTGNTYHHLGKRRVFVKFIFHFHFIVLFTKAKEKGKGKSFHFVLFPLFFLYVVLFRILNFISSVFFLCIFFGLYFWVHFIVVLHTYTHLPRSDFRIGQLVTGIWFGSRYGRL